MTAIFSAQVYGYGELTYVGSDDEEAVFQLILQGSFDACAIFEALDCLAIVHEIDFDIKPIILVKLSVKIGAIVRNPEGFTRMWARKLGDTANECHDDYLKSVMIIEAQPETVTSSCPHCGFLEVRSFPGGDLKALDEIGGELFDLHLTNSPECKYFPTWC